MSESDVAVTIEEISPVVKKLSFDIPWADVKKGLDEVYHTVGKTAKIKGFRQGKIPREVLEVYYKEHAENEVVSNLVSKFFWEALKKNSIDPITQPDINRKGIEKERNFTFTATVEVAPSIEPANYTGLELEKVERMASEEDINAKIEEIRQMFSTLEEVTEDRGSVIGDYVEIDFQGTLDGEALKSMKGESYLLELGSKRFIPGFEDNVIGMKRREEKRFTVRFPDDYFEKNLAGKEAEFAVTLKDIKVKKLPDLDEEFVRNVDKYESLEELKEGVRKSLEQENSTRTEAEFQNLIIDKLLQNNDFSVPPSFVERQIHYLTMDMQRRMVSGGMNRKDAAELSIKLHDKLKDEATRTVKSHLLIKSIARKEAISVGDEEVEERIQGIALESGQNYETVKKSFGNENAKEGLIEEMLHKKIIDFIAERSNVTVSKQAGTDDSGEGNR